MSYNNPLSPVDSVLGQPLLSPDNVEYLERTRNISPASGGLRIISVQSFSSASSTTSSTSFASIELPERINSVESLIYCGFTPEAASEVFTRYRNHLGGILERDLDDFMRGYIRSEASRHGDGVALEDDWDAALLNMGIREEKRVAILTSAYDRIRLTETASYWAIDTVLMEWEFLEDVDKKISKKKRREANLARNVSPLPGSTASPAINIRPLSGSSTAAGSAPQVLNQIAIPTMTPGIRMLYKGGSYSRLQRVFQSNGSLLFQRIYSSPPTDFHPYKAQIFYVSPSKETAHIYAGYARNRAPLCDTGILHLGVPNEVISRMTHIYGQDWSQLIWESRRQEAGDVSSHLQHYTEADVLVGHICGQSTKQVDRLESQTQLAALKDSDGVEVEQFAFQNAQLVNELNTACRCTVWLENTNNQVWDRLRCDSVWRIRA